VNDARRARGPPVASMIRESAHRMSSVLETQAVPAPRLPLLGQLQPGARLARHCGRDISQLEYLQDVRALARLLPDRHYAINLCECSYHFLVAFGAVLLRGQTNLLPASRAEAVVAEVQRDWESSHVVDDARVVAAIHQAERGTQADIPLIAGDHIAVIGFTSGSTGQPRPHPKTWAGFVQSTANNVAALRPLVGDAGFSILATVPPQHMYGIEMSVLMPLLAGATLYTRRSLFPADIAASLAELDEPRVLVSTPIHLCVLASSGQRVPATAAVVSATAPLSAELALRVEQALDTVVLEVFGSTETCVIGNRRTATEDSWQLMDQVSLSPQPDGTLVQAPWIAQATLLQDLVECLPGRRFVVRGRHADQIEIAGKRASLADVTRRLLAIEGVRDGVVVQDEGQGRVRRLTAIVVAPEIDPAAILAALRKSLDAAFVPRRIVRVAELPRNALGKLPRQALLECMRSGADAPGSAV